MIRREPDSGSPTWQPYYKANQKQCKTRKHNKNRRLHSSCDTDLTTGVTYHDRNGLIRFTVTGSNVPSLSL